MALVPQLLFFYDQLPLFFVCRTRGEALAFIGWGMAVMMVYLIPAFVGFGGPWAMVACYLPALLIVLRRPNEGPAFQWIERRILKWPQWIRGVSAAEARAIG
jgi:peptidoglycan/LPS O-acetylase OafA/YrhL